MVWFLVNRLCSRILLSIVKRRRATTLDWDIPVARKNWHKRSTGARLKVAKTAGEADELWKFGIEFVKISAVSQFFVAKNPKNFPGFILMWERNWTLAVFCGSNVQLESFMIGIMIRVIIGVMPFWGLWSLNFCRIFAQTFCFGLLLKMVNSFEEFVVLWKFFGTCGDVVFTVGGRELFSTR